MNRNKECGGMISKTELIDMLEMNIKWGCCQKQRVERLMINIYGKYDKRFCCVIGRNIDIFLLE